MSNVDQNAALLKSWYVVPASFWFSASPSEPWLGAPSPKAPSPPASEVPAIWPLQRSAVARPDTSAAIATRPRAPPVLARPGAVPLYAHHRHLGLPALAGAVASLALIPHKDIYRVGRIFWLVVGIITWGGMLWSGGRTPMFALALAVAVWAWLSPAPVRGRLCGRAAVLLVAGLALSAVFWTPNRELGWWHAIGRTASAAGTGSVSQLSSTRSNFWQDVVQRAKDAPWLGHGPDSYRFLTTKLDGQHTHNFVMQIWLGTSSGISRRSCL